MTPNLTTTLTSKTRTVRISRDLPTVVIGERINPTGRKAVQAALKDGDFELIRRDAVQQVAAGAGVLDVNAGVPGLDEVSLLPRLVQEVTGVVDVPLCIDTADPAALAAALERYEGKALVNSVNGEQKKLQAILPLVREHSAAVIGLCMDDGGIPSSVDGRFKVAAMVIEEAGKSGIPLEDVVIDPLAIAMGTETDAGLIALETIRRVVEEFGVNVTIGASNVSFGLPDRKYLNAAFLSMAIYAGLTCPITNPLVFEVKAAVLAADLSLGRDEYAMRWISDFRRRKKAGASAVS